MAKNHRNIRVFEGKWRAGMISADFGESPAGCGDAPARAGAVRADRREAPACAGRVRDVPEKPGYVAAEFGQLTENVGRVPAERGGVEGKVRLTVKKSRRWLRDCP